MYDQSFGLNRRPFNLTPDPAFLFLTAQHREALVGLTYAILQRKGFVALTGEAGTGKTTLLARVLHFLPASRVQFSIILNPTLTPAEFLELAMLDFGIKDIPASKAQRLWKLQELLFDYRKQGKVSALVLDEAHKLSPEVLEEVRLLGNFEEADHKLLQIVLVGQSELEDNLNRDDLRQLKQRIALWLQIRPLTGSDIEQYIRYRWSIAGGTQPPFSPEAIYRIGQMSGGVPRVINSLCENALISAFGEGASQVETSHILAAARDMKISDAHEERELEEHVEPEAESPSVEFPTLEVYKGSPRPSLWKKWARKLGWQPRMTSPDGNTEPTSGVGGA